MKSINNHLDKIKSSKMNDIYYLASKENQYKLKLENTNNNNNIRNKEFLKYKKEIKNKINELYSFHLDNSNNKIVSNINNENEKYINHFNLFIFHLIKHLKHEKIKSQIQKELTSFNSIIDNSIIDNSNLELCNDFSLNDLNKANNIMFNKSKPKPCTLEDFVLIKNIELKNKILPKKR
tara:strand:+ start:306 stop:842 length:537 start_codon:yes stop_codon:yes gene_type:complete